MNEASEKVTPGKDTAPKKAEKTLVDKYFEDLHAADKVTRIPISHLYFDEYMDFSAGGVSQMSNQACIQLGDPTAKMYRVWVCHFIPAWQVYELSFVPAPNSEPTTEMIPAVHIRRSKRF